MSRNSVLTLLIWKSFFCGEASGFCRLEEIKDSIVTTASRFVVVNGSTMTFVLAGIQSALHSGIMA